MHATRLHTDKIHDASVVFFFSNWSDPALPLATNSSSPCRICWICRMLSPRYTKLANRAKKEKTRCYMYPLIIKESKNSLQQHRTSGA